MASDISPMTIPCGILVTIDKSTGVIENTMNDLRVSEIYDIPLMIISVAFFQNHSSRILIRSS